MELTLTQARAEARDFNPLTHPSTSAFMGLLSDESRDVVLAHVRAEQDRRFGVAQAFKQVLDLCPFKECFEYVSLLSEISDALYPARICGPMTPERVAYEELMKPLASDEWAGTIEANLDELMNGPATRHLNLIERETEARARVEARKAAKAS